MLMKCKICANEFIPPRKIFSIVLNVLCFEKAKNKPEEESIKEETESEQNENEESESDEHNDDE